MRTDGSCQLFLFAIKTKVLYLFFAILAFMPASLGCLNGLGRAFAQSDTALENRASRSTEKNAEKTIGKGLEKQLEKRIEKQLSKSIESKGMSSIMKDPELRKEAIETIKSESAVSLNQNSSQSQGKSKAHKRNKATVFHDITQNKQGFYRLRKQWLILADASTVTNLERSGFEVIQSTTLRSLDKVLLEIREPENKTLSQVKQEKIEILRSSTIDYNHLFQTQTSPKKNPNNAWEPRSALHIKSVSASHHMAIGVIDTHVELSHEVFKSANIRQRSFVEKNLNEPNQHGTAIASMLVGSSKHYQGLLPNAKLYSASVFYNTPKIKHAASVKSLLLALNWLAQENVKIINMSLAGPKNSLLQYAIERLDKRGITILAAAGNNGPTAPPAFPAAYQPVVAVTAVNQKLKAYFKSNRGDYIDVAAPGVNIKHAAPDNQYTTSSGTSFAVPFASALAAYIESTASSGDIIDTLINNTKDLGKTGADEIYGSGLIQVPR